MSTGTGMQEERIKKVVITLDKHGKPQVNKEHEVVVLNRLNNEEILWISTEPFRIDFMEGSPFYEDQFDSTNAYSGLVRRSVLKSNDRIYKYTIDIKGKILDPGIKIDP
jgi:hypothetical protein